MRKWVSLGLIFLIMALGLPVGCATYEAPPEVPAVPDSEVPAPTPQPPANGATPTFDKPPPDDMNWISPGKVMVMNFYPGARAEYPITVHNGGDATASFAVDYRYPDHVDEGYEKPIGEVQDWVIIADTTSVLLPKETRDILVTLEMPEDADVFAPQWEFWISVIDTSQTGMVQTELCVRWLVTMR